MIVLGDLKSGFVDPMTWVQLGAYARGKTLEGRPLPSLDRGLILRVDDERVEPLWASQAQLQAASEIFASIYNVWQFMVKNKVIKHKEYYKIQASDEELLLPRVTSVIKAVINAEGLNAWRVRRGAEYTVEYMQQNQKSTASMLDALRSKQFDPGGGAMKFMKGRGNRGSELHKLVHAWLIGSPIPINPTDDWLKKAYGNFVEWAEATNLRLLENLAETQVYSIDPSYAGTLDFIAEVNDG